MKWGLNNKNSVNMTWGLNNKLDRLALLVADKFLKDAAVPPSNSAKTSDIAQDLYF